MTKAFKVERKSLPSIPLFEVERRILRACKTLRALPDPDRRFQWVKAAWPEVIRSSEDAYGYTDAAMPRFRPSPRDVSDMLLALSWARCLEWKEFRLIWWRSSEVSFGHMAGRIHRSDETARRWYRDATLKVWLAANTADPAGYAMAQ
jgi:hypothetical protein